MESRKLLTPRAKRPQKIQLLQYMKANPQLAFGWASSSSFNKKSPTVSWDEIALQLNNCTGGAVKTAKQWKKAWIDWRTSATKESDMHKPKDKLDSELLEFLTLCKMQNADDIKQDPEQTESVEEFDTNLCCKEESSSMDINSRSPSAERNKSQRANKNNTSLSPHKKNKSSLFGKNRRASSSNLAAVVQMYEERQNRHEKILLEILENQKIIVSILDKRLPKN